MTTPVYHSKGKDDWGTEQGLFDALDQEFHFDLDAAANGYNFKTPAWLSEEIDALQVDWWGRVFVNPPHSKADEFLVKLVQEFLAGRIEIGVALVAARTDTAAHHMMACYAGQTRYLKGRVKYELFPTEKQRLVCATLQGVTIEDQAWPMLVKEMGLPKTAIKKLMEDPNYIGPDLALGAPFPSVVFIVDGRKTPSTIYWDWRQGVKIEYVLGQGTGGWETVKASPWLKIKLGASKAGKVTAALKALGALKNAGAVALPPKPTQLKLISGITVPEGY